MRPRRDARWRGVGTRWLVMMLLGVGGALQADTGIDPGGADPTAQAIRRVLDERRHPDLRWPDISDCVAQARRVYEERSYRPLWTRDGELVRPVGVVLAELARAEERGLSSADYDAARLTSLRQASSSNDAAARFDVGLTVAVMRYASALHRGRLDPLQVGYAMDLWHDDLDVAAFVRRLAIAVHPTAVFAAIEPRSPMYDHLIAALPRLRAIGDAGASAAAGAIPKLRPGDVDGGVAALRATLAALGDLDDAGASSSPAYDDELVAAVRRFQDRHGLDADGIVGERTLAQLRVPISERVRQVEMSLERLRWLPDEPLTRLLLVNVPEFRLRVFDPGSWQPILEMKVVVGAAVRKTTTSIFRAEMKHVVFRPYWNVPRSIARGELLPQSWRNPDYLRRRNFEVVGSGPLTAAALSAGTVRLRQKPGPDNALGLVKFMFPNRFNMYMHDTPAKSLFLRSRRDFSHGCIRLEDPAGLAAYLLAEQNWDRAGVERAMNGTKSFQVDLQSPTWVQLFYLTAMADNDGTLSFYEDIYGHDIALSRRLEAGYPYRTSR